MGGSPTERHLNAVVLPGTAPTAPPTCHRKKVGSPKGTDLCYLWCPGEDETGNWYVIVGAL